MAKTYLTSNGDKCRSRYERDIVQHAIDLGLPYAYESVVLEYETAIVKGTCKACGATGRDVVQRRTYTPDIVLPNGIVVEIKGKFDASKRNLMRQLVRCNPDVDIRFIFMRDNRFGQAKTRKRYSDWARAQGVQCVEVPVDPKTKRIVPDNYPEHWWAE